MSGDVYVYRNSDLWNHTVMRIKNAEEKAKDKNGNFDNVKFVTAQVARLKRITHIEKVHYAIAVLKELGHNDVVEIYEGRLLIEEFKKNAGLL